MPEPEYFVILKTVGVLACIVGLMFIVVWLLKKLVPGVVRGPIQRVELGVVAQLSVGSRQRVAVIRVADRTLVIGVTEGSITTLAELETRQTAPAAQKEADDPKIFADLLAWRKDSPGAAPAAAAAPAHRPVAPVAAAPAAAPVEDDGPRLFAPGERPAR